MVGRFFRGGVLTEYSSCTGLNPHVVGRFFRVKNVLVYEDAGWVLIPMWWGGFSELT